MVSREGNGEGSELQVTTVKWTQQAKRRERKTDVLPFAQLVHKSLTTHQKRLPFLITLHSKINNE